MANPKTISWVGPTKYVDGTDFGASDLAGFQVSIDARPTVDLPTAFHADNHYSVDLSTLNVGFGDHAVTVATVAKNGKVSAASNKVAFTLVDERVPDSPFVSVA